MFQLH